MAVAPPLTVVQNAGLGCLFGLANAALFLPWTFAVWHVLGKPASGWSDVMVLGVLVLLLAIGAFSYNRANRWAAIRTLPVERRPPPAKSAPWFIQARRSARLTAALLGYGLAAYVLTMIGLLALIDLARRSNWPQRDLIPTSLYALLCFCFLVTWAQGTRLFNTLIRCWSLAIDRKRVDRLWDRDLDNDLATESRSAS